MNTSEFTGRSAGTVSVKYTICLPKEPPGTFGGRFQRMAVSKSAQVLASHRCLYDLRPCGPEFSAVM